MIISIKKFGAVLTSRQSGREAYAAFLPILKTVPSKEEVLIDFEGVNTLAPSWADEFLTPIKRDFGQRLSIKKSDNPSVRLTLKTLESIGGVAL